MLKTKVKASSVSNLTDARYFAAVEVEWLGFALSPGEEGYCPPSTARGIRDWVDGVRIVGEFNLESPEEIFAVMEVFPLDAVQAPMFTPVKNLIALSAVCPVIQEVVLNTDFSEPELQVLLDQNGAFVDYFLLNFEKNRFDWPALLEGRPLGKAALSRICTQYPVLLGIDADADTVLEILDAIPVKGLSIRGGTEEKIGFKSFDELDAIFDRLSS